MNTTRPVLFIFPRAFTVREGKVVLQSAVPSGNPGVPIIARTHVSSGTLRARMQVWSELVHAGEHDPVGHDRLSVHLALSLSSAWIRRPAGELLHTICESSGELHLWLASTERTLLAANRLVRLPRFSDETIHFAFAPLFDTAAALNNHLKDDTKKRRRLWERAMEEGLAAESPHQARFRLKFP